MKRDARPLPTVYNTPSPYSGATSATTFEDSLIRIADSKYLLYLQSRWGISSVGRAFEWHSKGQEFDSPMLTNHFAYPSVEHYLEHDEAEQDHIQDARRFAKWNLKTSHFLARAFPPVCRTDFKSCWAPILLKRRMAGRMLERDLVCWTAGAGLKPRFSIIRLSLRFGEEPVHSTPPIPIS